MNKVAEYFEKFEDGSVICNLCPAECHLTNDKIGICGCRFNKDGELYTNNYGELVTLAVDPIEKKPLYHFHPTKSILSTGANGCNFACEHCQNWTISQEKVKTVNVSPKKLVETAIQHDSFGVAFTYTEPMIWYEYICDTAPLLKEVGLKVVLVSNGYINPEPLQILLKHIDAINVDLKGIKEEFYKKVCKGKIQPILDNIRAIHDSSVHLEITNLLIPGKNDSIEDITELVDFVASLSDDIPLHISAYHPDYKMDIPATSPTTIKNAFRIAKNKLNYVYVGNMYSEEGSDTYCPSCNYLLINRLGYRTSIVGLKDSNCKNCGFNTGIIQ
jgi:pyruvate formate lyase activating enzyme